MDRQSLEHLPVFDSEPNLSSPLSIAELALIGYSCNDPELAPYIVGPWQSYVFGIVKNHPIDIPANTIREDLLLTIGYNDVLEVEPGVIVPQRWHFDLKPIQENSRHSDAVISSYQVLRKYNLGELVMRKSLSRICK